MEADVTRHTCLKLHVGDGQDASAVFVKGTWFAAHFQLSITDGVDAWTCNATEAEVRRRAEQWDQPVSEYIAMAERYLGFQQPGSVYRFEDAGNAQKRVPQVAFLGMEKVSGALIFGALPSCHGHLRSWALGLNGDGNANPLLITSTLQLKSLIFLWMQTYALVSNDGGRCWRWQPHWLAAAAIGASTNSSNCSRGQWQIARSTPPFFPARSLEEEVVSVRLSFERLKLEAEKCLAQSEKFCNEKVEFESAVYGKFVAVLNSKKAKLRELRDSLSKSQNTVRALEDEDESSEKREAFDGESSDDETK